MVSVWERRPSALRVGAVVWLASELMFFAGLFAAWFGLRAVAKSWPPPGVELATLETGAATVVLILSSFTLHAGVRSAERGETTSAIRWTLVTAGLGTAFLANQAAEYATSSFTPTEHPFGAMFFMLTGFHGAHVLAGVVLMLAVLAVGAGQGTRAPLVDPLTVASYYWHFVDVVWVAMFTTIYLIR